MRSQIGGLTQGVKNAQDGISMIQTFEGALTETDSILQRMKTLADQAANGTYQNEVDRDAIQLEFDQLNDELNQIADTDYNGVVVLNGGQMADGLKQVDGKFDYSLKQGQVDAANAEKLAAAQAEAQKKIDSAQKAFDSAKLAYNNVANRDLSNNGDAIQWNTVDDSTYTSTLAKKLFDTAQNAGGDSLTDAGISSVDITFKWGGTNWTANKLTYVDNDGVRQTGDVRSAFSASLSNASKSAAGGATGLGGFEVKDDNGNVYANAIFDATDLKAGDTVTLTFTNSAKTAYAPKNIGMDDNSYKTASSLSNVSVPTIKLTSNVVDDKMDQELTDALKKLDQAHVSFDYQSGKLEASVDQGLKIVRDANSTATKEIWKIQFTNEAGNDVDLASVTLDPSRGASTGKATTTKIYGQTEEVAITGGAWSTTGTVIDSSETLSLIYDGNGWVTEDGTTAANALTASTEFKGITDVTNLYTGTPAKGDKINLSLTLNSIAGEDGIDITGGSDSAALDAGDKRKAVVNVDYQQSEATLGELSFDVALKSWDYSATSKGPDVTASKDFDRTEDTTAIDKNYLATKSALAEAKAAYPNSVDDLPKEDKVSVSDAFDNAAIPMTYTDHIILQAGARSKDAVDFTFKYSSQGMGKLDANMNCSAREDGLNTASLSLRTAKDANAAIDQIDHAINKVSMVRATFGAAQNRLEHKIDNMNVTKENLTSAESRIRDTNIAEEMSNFTKNQILSQASQSMLAQANSLPQGALQLLG